MKMNIKSEKGVKRKREEDAHTYPNEFKKKKKSKIDLEMNIEKERQIIKTENTKLENHKNVIDDELNDVKHDSNFEENNKSISGNEVDLDINSKDRFQSTLIRNDKKKNHKRRLNSENSKNVNNTDNDVHNINYEGNTPKEQCNSTQSLNKSIKIENILNPKTNTPKTEPFTSQNEDDIASNSEVQNSDAHHSNDDEDANTTEKAMESIFDEYKDHYDLNIDFFEKLENETLQVYWNLPKLHTITKQLIRLPGKDVKEEIKKLKLPLKEGHFNSDEDKRIAKNWTKLCEKYNLPDTPDVFANWRNGKRNSQCSRIRRFIILWLSRKLPDRLPSQVYHRFLHNMGNTCKGRFTETETEMIETFMSMDSNNRFTQQYLGAILGRDEASIWRRIKLLKQQKSMETFKNSQRIKWDLDMCEKLIFAILSVIFEGKKKSSHIKSIMKLKDRPIIWTEWIKIGEKISVSPLSAKIVWNQKLYIQLFSTEPIYKNKIISILLHKFHEMQYKDWKRIDWKIMASDFPIFTTTFVFKIFYFFALKECQNLMKKFPEMIEFLYNKFIVDGCPIKNLKLKRLILNDEKKLIFHPEDVKKNRASNCQ